jgi:hypothetical protein
VAFSFWEYYQYTGDADFLKEYAYPVIKGVAEFYRTFPHIKLAEDGKYHTYHTNSSESYYNGTDSMAVLSGMHGVLPVAIKASELLGTDTALREKWRERLELLFPLPASDDKRIKNSQLKTEKPVWVSAVCDYYGEAQKPISDASIVPVQRCDLCSLETEFVDRELFETGKRSVAWMIENHPMSSRRMVSEMSSMGRVLAAMGYGSVAAEMIVNQINCANAAQEYCYYDNNGRTPQYENRLTSREGINAMSAQRLGNISSALQKMLLPSSGGAPAAEPVIRVCPAMPGSWNARFQLFAKGGFQVEALYENGRISYVKITSTRGGELHLRSPWPKEEAAVQRNGEASQGCTGDLLSFPTKAGDVLVLIQKGAGMQ